MVIALLKAFDLHIPFDKEGCISDFFITFTKRVSHRSTISFDKEALL
jgi:hypothetical protein